MKIGIFGGSFNPIHYGHINLAKGIMATKMVDELWFVVSPHNPLKDEAGLMPNEERLQKVQDALKDIAGVKASDFEFHLPKPSYMYLTLQELEKEYPQHTFHLIIGADNWICFDKWKEYRQILDKHHIIIYPRESCDIDTTKLPPTVSYLDLPLYNISSTQIRRMKENGEDISSLIPQPVAQTAIPKTEIASKTFLHKEKSSLLKTKTT